MWPLTNGSRCLVGPEADLFRGGVGMMVDQLVEELNSTPDEAIPPSPSDYPHAFAMWEPEQRVWLLLRVATSVLTSRVPPPHAAIFDATIEAVYCEISDQIAMEVLEGSPIDTRCWRQSLLDAYGVRCPQSTLTDAMGFQTDTTAWFGTNPNNAADPRPAELDQVNAAPHNHDEENRRDEGLAWWTSVVDRLLDATFGVRYWRDAERYRDGDPHALRAFLVSKGIRRDYITRIPPLKNRGQAQAAIDRLQGLVFDKE